MCCGGVEKERHVWENEGKEDENVFRTKCDCVVGLDKVLNQKKVCGRGGTAENCESLARVSESSQEGRRSDWLRRERGVFQGSKESRGRLAEEWTEAEQCKQSGLAAVRVCLVCLRSCEEAGQRNLSVHKEGECW